MIGNGSWFVEIDYPQSKYDVHTHGSKKAVPHVVGLCGNGTMGHHGDLEEHRAWIKLEDEEFVWYERDSMVPEDMGETMGYIEEAATVWTPIGPLDPQPGDRHKNHKRRKSTYKGEKPRHRVTKSIRAPKDAAEDGIEVLEALIEQAAEKLQADEGTPDYYILVPALYYFVANYEGSDG
jgi:hypothetical protein